MPDNSGQEGLSKINRKRFELDPVEAASYKPVKSAEALDYEREIANELVDNGVEQEVALAVIGHSPEEIPFIYKTEPHETINGGPGGGKVILHLWMGSSDAIHNLDAEWSDQVPEVLAQWWGHQKPGSDQIKVERLEAHPLSDGSGRFVHVSYKNVSGMGAFDGEISSLELYTPVEKFRPWGGPRERWSYRINGFFQDKNGKWNIDLGRSGVSGTTILNGFEQILNFNLADTRPIKADAQHAYRLSPPPPDVIPALPGTVEEEYQTTLAKAPRKKAEMVESLHAKAHELMGIIGPMVLKSLQEGRYSLYDVAGMAVDGILHHPEKIPVFEQKLSNLPRQRRFLLAQFTTALIKEGKFTQWIKTLSEPKNQPLVTDTISRNTYHLLDWFLRTAPANANLSQWLDNALSAATDIKAGKRTHSDEFTRCFDGMTTSFVERYIEFLVQQYFGNSLV